LTRLLHVGKVRAMLKLALFIALVTLVGCGRGGTVATPLGDATGEGNWFCEMAEDPEQWDCVQDSELARAPQPTRLPSADVRELPAPESADSPALHVPEPPPISEIPDADANIDEAVADTSDPGSVEEPAPAQGESPASKPETAEAQPDPSLLNLPPEHYAVQLIAMTNEAALVDFASTHLLDSYLTARVERSGELYYVLLLGVYGTHNLAEQARQALPESLNAVEPWIRPVRSIQNAILRGNVIATGAD
jgi:septal ring-binding cell division protein DamX